MSRRDTGETVASGEVPIARLPASSQIGIVEVGGGRSSSVLEGGRAYRIGIHIGGASLGDVDVRMPPTAADCDVRLMFGSCAQPWLGDGRPDSRATAMLDAAARHVASREIDLWCALGDQVYSDLPSASAIVDRGVPPTATAEQLWERFEARYRDTWALPAWQHLMRGVAFYPVIDDHDIVDNFGSDPLHASAEYEPLRAAAQRAYFAFQGSRVLPPERGAQGPFDFGFRHGPIAGYAFDLRTQRCAIGRMQLLGHDQLDRFDQHVARHSDARLHVVLLSQPFLNLPRSLLGWFARLLSTGNDLDDRLSHPMWNESRAALLDRIHRLARSRPRGSVILLAGDVHVGATHELVFADGTSVPQLTSSPLAHPQPWWVSRTAQLVVGLADRFPRSQQGGREDVVLRRLESEVGGTNPYGGLNVGSLRVRTSGARTDVDFELLGVVRGDLRPVLRLPTWTY
ncbi:MAG: alkaline phosphatase D family protein [Planctomycetota bacterium]